MAIKLRKAEKQFWAEIEKLNWDLWNNYKLSFTTHKSSDPYVLDYFIKNTTKSLLAFCIPKELNKFFVAFGTPGEEEFKIRLKLYRGRIPAPDLLAVNQLLKLEMLK